MKQGMIRIALYTFGLIVSATPVIAGQVYGTVTDVRGPVKKVPVKITCPKNETPGQASTDQYGSYSVYVNASGKCTVTVNGIEALPIRVYDDDVRYDLHIEANKLRRK